MDPESVLLPDVIDDIYGEIVVPRESTRLPIDAAIAQIGGMLTIHFVVDICYTNWTRTGFVITNTHLQRWDLTLDELIEIAGRNVFVTPINIWLRETCARVYRYPTLDTAWVGAVLSPDTKFDDVDIDGPPLIMVPTAETVLLTGANDRKGQRSLLAQTMRWCDREHPMPITRRPLILDAPTRKWERLPDCRNPLRAKYSRRFGTDPGLLIQMTDAEPSDARETSAQSNFKSTSTPRSP